MKFGIIFTIIVGISLGFMLVQVNAEIDPATIVGLWLFDEGKGDTAGDASGNGLDGTVKGKAKWVDGKFGKALELDGSTAYVEVPAHENPRAEITITIWVKSKTAAWNQHGFFVEKRNAFVLHPNANSKNVAWALCNNGCWNKPHAWSTNAVGPNDITEWHMYTVTYDSNSGDWLIYIDGKEESSLELNKDPIDADVGALFIGNDTCCAGRFGNAIVDEVAIFNVALSPDEIESMMDHGLEGSALAVDADGKMTTAWGKIKTRF